MSMPVQLQYPQSGAVALSADLPFPALSIPIKIEPNQKEYRAAAGNLWTCKIGPTMYQLQRSFENLTEEQTSGLFAFLEGVGFYGKIRYAYTRPSTGERVEVPCRIVEAPSEKVAMIGVRDFSLTFMQYKHPDDETEKFYQIVNSLIDDSGDSLIDDQGNILIWE